MILILASNQNQQSRNQKRNNKMAPRLTEVEDVTTGQTRHLAAYHSGMAKPWHHGFTNATYLDFSDPNLDRKQIAAACGVDEVNVLPALTLGVPGIIETLGTFGTKTSKGELKLSETDLTAFAALLESHQSTNFGHLVTNDGVGGKMVSGQPGSFSSYLSTMGLVLDVVHAMGPLLAPLLGPDAEVTLASVQRLGTFGERLAASWLLGTFKPDNDPNGSEVRYYLSISDDMNGALRIVFSCVRVVCANTEAIAFAGVDKGIQHTIHSVTGFKPNQWLELSATERERTAIVGLSQRIMSEAMTNGMSNIVLHQQVNNRMWELRATAADRAALMNVLAGTNKIDMATGAVQDEFFTVKGGKVVRVEGNDRTAHIVLEGTIEKMMETDDTIGDSKTLGSLRNIPTRWMRTAAPKDRGVSAGQWSDLEGAQRVAAQQEDRDWESNAVGLIGGTRANEVGQSTARGVTAANVMQARAIAQMDEDAKVLIPA